MKIALAQINTKVGDLENNTKKIIDNINKAKDSGVDLVIFPELSITGYPPRDLLDFPAFIEDSLYCLEKIKDAAKDIAIVCGYIDINKKGYGKKYFNSAVFIANKQIISTHNKCLLPFYDVFDETRYFEPGKEVSIIDFLDKKIAITICEDIWNDKGYWERPLYKFNPVEEIEKNNNVDLIINLSASPFWLNKPHDRINILKSISKKQKTHLFYVNQVGGNDDLIFDGSSLVIDPDGNIVAQASDFEEDLLIYDLNKKQGKIAQVASSEEESILKALTLGLKDYCQKSGFKKVIIGLSGGIDSALTATIAAQALGGENVLGITMPSMYSSTGSVDDSLELAKNLGMECLTVPIANMFNSFIENIQKDQGLQMSLAEENLQARIRGNILMMYSNNYGYLLVSTGNKSELSVGYCTLYGDMAGGLALLSDVPKTMVYKVSKFINKDKEIIPNDTITKAPSAELRPDQKDQDSLPPYEVLDDILKDYVEDYKTFEIISQKYDAELVKSIIKKINLNEYKRRQSSLGLKVTTKAFGHGRRFPIVQGYNFRIPQ